MADSTIAFTSLNAQGGVGQIALNWSIDGTSGSCLPYLALDVVEVWAATTNNRANAVKVGEARGLQFPHTGLNKNNQRYYWIRAKDVSGNLGEFYPASATGGVQGRVLQTAPDADVVSDISSDLGDINAGTITGITINGTTINGGTINGTAMLAERLRQGNVSGIHVDINNGRVTVFDSSANPVAYLGDSAPIVGAVLVAQKHSGGGLATVDFRNNNAGGWAMTANGRAQFLNSIGGMAVYAERTQNQANGDAIVANNSGSGGGTARIGRAAVNGGHAFFAQSGGYAPFTGQHDGLIDKDAVSSIGDIVVDVRVIARNGVDDTVTEVTVAAERAQKAAIGIVSRRVSLDIDTEFAALPRGADNQASWLHRKLVNRYDHVVINSVGEGQMNVCGRGGDIEAGDLIWCSDLQGKGEKQSDDIVRGCTVAKARESVTFEHPDQVKRVACIYLCG